MHLNPGVRLTRSAAVILAAVLAILGSSPWPYAHAQPRDRGLGIAIVGAPGDRADVGLGRAIYDAGTPGTTRTWRLAIENDTPDLLPVELFVVDLVIGDQGMAFGEDETDGVLADWVTIRPGHLELQARERAEVEVEIQVPPSAGSAELLGAVVAEPPAVGSGVRSIQRVAVPLLFAAGDELNLGDFEIRTMTPFRDGAGSPGVDVLIRNTGTRTLIVAGTLELVDGPGGLSVSPVGSANSPRVDPSDEGTVRFLFDAGIPAGPWTARAVLSGGAVQRAAEASVTFPDPGAVGSAGEAATATPFELDRDVLLPINIVLFVLVLVASIAWWLWDRGRAGRDTRKAGTRSSE